jgi:predicted metal-dependent phosphoesterase TrpH
VDLHLHSNRSDGLLEPAAVVEAASTEGLAAAALTDHDTLAGLSEAAERAQALGLPFVPGIELSAHDDSGSTHLLGYFIDATERRFVEHLEGAQAQRAVRAEVMVEKLNRLGMGITLEEVRAHAARDGLIARPHVARALVDGGWVGSYNEAFNRFLAAGQPAYEPTQRIAPAEAIRLIHDASGLAVLAHGGRSHGDVAIRDLVEAGLDGLEILHPDHGFVEVRRLRRLARELQLLETGGSDWHGPYERRRGGLGFQPVPYEWYVRLREAADARRASAARGEKD